MTTRKLIPGFLVFFNMLSVQLVGQVDFRQMYLSGKVTLPDGSPPPGLAQMELVCNGQVQPQEYSKEDGSFAFAVGGNTAGSISARGNSTAIGSSGESQSYVNMSDCQVRAALAGYNSSVIQLGRRSVFESPDIGTIVLTPLGEGGQPVRDPLVSVSMMKAPEKAAKSYEKGKEELFKEKPDAKKAVKELEKAVKEYPEYSAAWYLMGEARVMMGEADAGREALQKAIETDLGFATPYVTLALLELRQSNLEAAAEASDQAIELVPTHAEACYYNGMAYANLGNLEKAQTSLEVVAASPHAERFPQTFYLLGTIIARSGDLEASLPYYDRFLELAPDSNMAQAVRQQIDEWRANGYIK
jgi:Tfp pilus assembly protein PilF